jgi:leader peptidase (prepilin peptidase) / N-methyltransferase
MTLIFYAFVLFIGLCVGSFLNVCIYRLPRAMSLVSPGSHCPHCNEPIAWYDNIPILSWLSLGGQCRRCGVVISARYLFVELFTGLMFVWVYAAHRSAPSDMPLEHIATFGAYLVLLAALIASSMVDIERMIIPDEISIGGMYVGPILCAIWPEIIHKDQLLTGWLLELTGAGGSPHLTGLAASVIGMGIGAASIYAAAVFGKILFRKEAMGFGDVKFMGMVGAFIGWQGALLSFLVACLLGAVVGIVLLIRRRDTHIPFGPYLAAGTVIVMLHPRGVLHWFLNFPTIIQSWFA